MGDDSKNNPFKDYFFLPCLCLLILRSLSLHSLHENDIFKNNVHFPFRKCFSRPSDTLRTFWPDSFSINSKRMRKSRTYHYMFRSLFMCACVCDKYLYLTQIRWLCLHIRASYICVRQPGWGRSCWKYERINTRVDIEYMRKTEKNVARVWWKKKLVNGFFLFDRKSLRPGERRVWHFEMWVGDDL